MSVHTVPLAPDPAEPPWSANVRTARLGQMLSLAQIHITGSGRRKHTRVQREKVADLLATIAISSLDGLAINPESWRPQIVAVLEALPYKEGCCTWRD